MQKLNPAALEPLYGAAVRASQVISIDSAHPHLWNQLVDAIALAESAPAEQPLSGSMTIEQAREIVRRVWVLMLDPSREPWSDLQERIAGAVLEIDRKARRVAGKLTLKRVRQHALKVGRDAEAGLRRDRAEESRRAAGKGRGK
jgi:hypothetical protein